MAASLAGSALAYSDGCEVQLMKSHPSLKAIVGALLGSLLTSWTAHSFPRSSVDVTPVAPWPLLNVAEGFSSDPKLAPLVIQAAWSSTFLVLFDEPTSYHLGTAFLIQKKALANGSTDVYFITNQHVVQNNCTPNGVCPELTLNQRAQLAYEPGGLHLLSSDGLFKKITVVGRSENPDLALLKANVATQSDRLPEPLVVSKSCVVTVGEPLVTVGFPDTSVRTDPSSLPIDQKNMITKRWSQGVLTGSLKFDVYSNGSVNNLIGTTIDVVGGNSGGAVINRNGEVVGVIKGAVSVQKNNFRYDGNETPGALDWQSYAVRCEELKEFLQAHLPK
jgi:S1-C subfamily serine protease